MDWRKGRGVLTDSIPEWEAKYVEQKISRPSSSLPLRMLQTMETLIDTYTHPKSLRNVAEILTCINQIIEEDRLGKRAVVIGCGPEPVTVRDLVQNGYEVVGIEPIEEGIQRAREYLAGTGVIMKGSAENIPLEDGSQTLVLMENVLEHVDSVSASLAESYRVLKPGGVLFVRTTNRTRFSLTGINWEFTTRFYNWFPLMVKESYVFAQLHYRPELAHYSPRPAVHWFSFPDLCELGREVGFARFYSPYDLLYLTKKQLSSDLSFRFKHWCRRQPWIRAMVVSQMVGDIFMCKRQE